MRITLASLLLVTLHCLWTTPRCVAEETFQKVLISEAWKRSTVDVKVKTKMRTPGGYEEERSGESIILLKRGASEFVLFDTVINTEPGKRLLTDSEMIAWSGDYSGLSYRSFDSTKDRWGYLCTMHMREFLLIPSAENAAFLDKNFRITSAKAEDGRNVKVQFGLKAKPKDPILKIFAKQKALLGGVMEIDPETKFVRSVVLDFVRGEHKRRHEVSATYEVGELAAEIFKIPEQVRERIDEMRTKAREQDAAPKP
ncbi:MAG: hypothetical protein OER86_06130 [Phycisphaerae bacterium]|nr:hypothetical protein [Phycisphaerae bacterium]